jgi:hypothetical protein
MNIRSHGFVRLLKQFKETKIPFDWPAIDEVDATNVSNTVFVYVLALIMNVSNFIVNYRNDVIEHLESTPTGIRQSRSFLTRRLTRTESFPTSSPSSHSTVEMAAS